MKSVTKSKVISAVLLKDLRIELRSRVLTNQVLPFAGLVLVMFAFALDNDDVLQRVAGGLVFAVHNRATLVRGRHNRWGA